MRCWKRAFQADRGHYLYTRALFVTVRHLSNMLSISYYLAAMLHKQARVLSQNGKSAKGSDYVTERAGTRQYGCRRSSQSTCLAKIDLFRILKWMLRLRGAVCVDGEKANQRAQSLTLISPVCTRQCTSCSRPEASRHWQGDCHAWLPECWLHLASLRDYRHAACWSGLRYSRDSSASDEPGQEPLKHSPPLL